MIYRELIDNYMPVDRDAIVVSISGGLDSALMLYLTMLKVTEQNLSVKVYALHQYEKPITIKYAQKIYDFCKTRFSNVNSEFIKIEFYRDKTGDKNESMEKNFESFIKSNELYNSYIFWGGTKALPELELPSIPEKFITQRDPNIDPEIHRSEDYLDSVSLYLPFTHINKHHIFEIYNHLLLQDLEEITLTCGVTDNDIPCKKCWWCKEKFLAFGYF